MFSLIECRGHPRDMGFAQGLALRTAIARQVAARDLPGQRRRGPTLTAFSAGEVRGAGAGREMIRHFTHLAERVDGLARGARIPVDSIFRLQVEVSALDPEALALSAIGLDSIPGASLVRSLPGRDWVIRRSRPEVGFASIEVAHPWHVGASAGLNELGLAASIVPGPPSSGDDGLAPVLLLVQECLQRFGNVDAGLGWCMNRPVGGEGTILLADASGDRATIRFEVGGGTLAQRGDSIHCAGGSASLLESIKAQVQGGRELDLKAIEQTDVDGRGLSIVRLGCRRRILEIQGIAGHESRFFLPLESSGPVGDA